MTTSPPSQAHNAPTLSQQVNVANQADQQPHFNVGIEWRDLDIQKYAIVGSIYYTAENALVYPFKTLKTHLQVDTRAVPMTLAAKYRYLTSQYGIKGLYKGFVANSVATVPSIVVYILLYNYLRDTVAHYADKATLWHFNNNSNTTAESSYNAFRDKALLVPAIAAIIADVTLNLYYVPVEVITQRVQLQQQQSFYQVGRELIKREGFRALYRGYGATIVMDAPASAVSWAVYEQAKVYFSENDPRALVWQEYGKAASNNNYNSTDKYEQNYLAQSLAGILSGTAISVISNPVDVVKTRMQTQNINDGDMSSPNKSKYYKNVIQGMAEMIKTEGFKSIWRGLNARIAGTAPVWAVTSIAYEFLLKFCRKGELDHVKQ